MSNAVQSTTAKQVTYPPIVQLKADLLRTLENRKQSLGNIINERHIQIACLEIEKTPALLRCSPRSIFESIVKAGLYKWVIGGVLGQAYIVPFGGEATLIAGYKGLRDLVRRSGQADTTIEAIHDGDTFTYNGPYAAPTHIPSDAADRRFKPITGAYVLVYLFASKATKCFYWTVGQCKAHRDHYSKSWARDKTEKNLWHENNDAFPVMCMKTVLRSVIARGEVPMSLDDVNLLHEPDEDDSGPKPQGSVIDASYIMPDGTHIGTVSSVPSTAESPKPQGPDGPTETPPAGAGEPQRTQDESQEDAKASAAALEDQYKEAMRDAADDKMGDDLLKAARKDLAAGLLDQAAMGRIETASNAAWKARHPETDKPKKGQRNFTE